MSLSKKLASWVDAKLITPEQSTQISLYEAQHHSGLFWKTALFIAGQLIGLGIIMIIASNWENIPDNLKLTINFIIFSAFAGGAYFAITKNRPHLRELFLILCFLMVAATIGLTAQIYNLDGGWETFALSWALLGLPFILLSRMTFFNICWFILLLSAKDFFSDLMDWLGKDLYRFMFFSIITTAIGYGAQKAHDYLKNKTQSVILKAFACFCIIFAYCITFGFAFQFGFDDYSKDSTVLTRFQTHAFVFLFLCMHMIIGLKTQNAKKFQYNAAFTEIYIFFLFCHHVNQLWTEGLSFIISGILILVLLYVLKKTCRSINQMEIFK